MKTKWKNFSLCSLLLWAFTACSDDGETTEGALSGLPVEVTVGLEPREGEPAESWNTTTEAGLYLFRQHTTMVVNDVRNLRSAVDGQNRLTCGLLRPEIHATALLAYAPYREDAGLTFNVDLTDQSDPQALDLLYAEAELPAVEQDPEMTACDLIFRHKLTRLAFSFEAGGDVRASALQGMQLQVGPLKSEAQFSVVSGQFTGLKGETQLTARLEENAREGSLLVLPQSPAQLDFQLTLADGKCYRWSDTRHTDLAEGKNLNFRITIGQSEIKVAFGGISDWDSSAAEPGQVILGDDGTVPPPEETRTYAVGDFYPDALQPSGIVFEVDATGQHGKVFALKEVQKRWGASPHSETADGITGLDNVTDGSGATRELILKHRTQSNWAGDYAAFDWLLTEMNGGDTGGPWYCPANGEAQAIARMLTQEISDRIKEAGGNEINFYGRMVTINEIDETNVYCVSYMDGSLLTDKKKTDTFNRLRPVRVF